MELTVTVAIGMLVTVAALQATIVHQKRADLAVSNANRAIVFSALDSFYGARCREAVKPQPTVAGLTASGYLQDTNAVINPLGGDYRVAIVWGPPARLQIRSTIPADATAGIVNAIKPDTIIGNDFIWYKSPDYAAQQIDVFNDEFVAAYGNDCQ